MGTVSIFAKSLCELFRRRSTFCIALLCFRNPRGLTVFFISPSLRFLLDIEADLELCSTMIHHGLMWYDLHIAALLM